MNKAHQEEEVEAGIKMGSTYADFTSANITGLMVRIIRKDFLPCVL